ncbi:hypothetical protein [Chelativorans sp.]|uniref:hypothetical protein n=1 Tax=Chelativorans sp. TaxID=2203393 RepID=UPI002811A0DA|nr:hypothetical protein [Chelativorans sp.]
MQGRTALLLAASAAAVVAAAGAILLRASERGEVAGTVRDARSGLPVAGVTLVLGERVQTLMASSRFSFGEGGGTLHASAPGYEDLAVAIGGGPLDLRMEPRTVPQAQSLTAFLRLAGDALMIDVQLRGREGLALEFFPAIDIPAEVRLATEDGRVLFEGRLQSEIDPGARFEKLKYRLPGSAVAGLTGTERFLLDIALVMPERVISWRREGLALSNASS